MIPIISEIIGLGRDYLEGKRKQSRAKAERRAQAIQNLTDWEVVHAQGAGASWKDEFWTIVLAMPFIGNMLAPFMDPIIPDFSDKVLAGIERISLLPDWYLTLVLIAIGAAFGVRQFKDFKLLGRKER